jgi:hypothetical protein
MALRDHAVFFVVGVCAAAVTATWAVSEQVRVAPLKAMLAKQEALHQFAPEIRDVTVTRTRNGDVEVLEQNIQFSDPDGDAVFVNYIVLATDAKTLRVESASIDTTREVQISGATYVARWTCGTGRYFVKVRAVITDRGGHTSRPYDYTLNCNM